MGRIKQFTGYILTLPYALVIWLRNLAFDRGVFKSYRFDTPSICVGNISVGGTGKTPFIIYLLSKLNSTDPIAVLSRGYKRKGKSFRYVNRNDKPEISGDEPLLIKKKFPNVIVAVDTDRVDGMRRLRRDNINLKAVLLDDAFQHRRLKPTFNILLIDYQRPLSRDTLLPFGTLRDLPSQAGRADCILVTKCPSVPKIPFFADNRFHFPIPTYFVCQQYGALKPLFEGTPPATTLLSAPQIIALSGIARPASFIRHISKQYEVLKHFRFADHHIFSPLDLLKIRDFMDTCPRLALVTTEKDAVRLIPHRAFFEQGTERTDAQTPVLSRFFYLPVEPRFTDPAAEKEFLERINKAIN